MAQNITQEILEIVAVVLEKEPGEISLDARLIQDLGADSMMALEILASMEKKYRIVISEDQLKDMTTVNKIIALVESAKKKTK